MFFKPFIPCKNFRLIDRTGLAGVKLRCFVVSIKPKLSLIFVQTMPYYWKMLSTYETISMKNDSCSFDFTDDAAFPSLHWPPTWDKVFLRPEGSENGTCITGRGVEYRLKKLNIKSKKEAFSESFRRKKKRKKRSKWCSTQLTMFCIVDHA